MFRNFGTEDAPEPKRVVSLLTGPDRDSWQDWQGFGFVSERGISVWRKHRDSALAKMARLLEDIPKGERSGLVYHLEGRCRCCNRALTNPESIKLGIGPICAARD